MTKYSVQNDGIHGIRRNSSLFSEKEWLSTTLEEYRAVRAEILAAFKLQQQVIAFGVTVLAAATALGLNFLQKDPTVTVGLGLIAPLIALVVILVWVGELERMVRAGAWVSMIEQRLWNLFGELPPPLGWETALRGGESPFPIKRVLYRYRGILVVLLLLSNSSNLAALWANWGSFPRMQQVAILLIQGSINAAAIAIYFYRESRALAIGSATNAEVKSAPLYKSSFPATCVAGVVRRDDGAMLCVKRSKEPGAGRWTLPGGHLEFGETGEQAVVRELREETGLTCRSAEFLGVYDYIEADSHLVILIFDCRCEQAPAVPGDDAKEVAWFLPEALINVPKTDGLFDRVAVLHAAARNAGESTSK